jgi:hypothetical protein
VGFLLFSDADASTLLKHWRHLLTVKHPSAGEVMPRIADPAVMHHLFDLARQQCALVRPRPVPVSAGWSSGRLATTSASGSPAPDSDTYRFDRGGTHGPGRGAVSSWYSTSTITCSISPVSWRPAQTGSACQFAEKTAREAHRLGFTSEQEITLYANVYAYLSGQPLSDHPDIVGLC